MNSRISEVTWTHKLAGLVGAGYLHLVGKTSFVQVSDNPECMGLLREKKPVIYAFWHNTQVYLAYAHRLIGAHVIVSQSKDGEYINQVMKRLGLFAVRGSSSRGGTGALRDLVRLIQNNQQIGVTPDGPRGPVQSVQGGVVILAQLTGVPIIPVSYAGTRKIVFNSWDKFMLPLPFGSIAVTHGKPLYLDRDLPMDQAVARVRETMNKNTDDAEQTLKEMPLWGINLLGIIVSHLYTVLSIVFLPLTFLGLLIRFGRKRTFRFLKERVSPNIVLADNTKRNVWLHCASIGEWQALKPILKGLRKLTDLEFVLTVSGPESRLLVAKENPELLVHMLPIDLPWIQNAWLKQLKPIAAIIVETEFWPRMLIALKKKTIPVFLVNGRLSSRNFQRWLWFRPFVHRILSCFSYFYPRTDLDGRHLVQLGASVSRMEITGNTKYDNLQAHPPTIENQRERSLRRHRLFGDLDGIIVAAGSTWSGEEEAVLNLFQQQNPQRIRVILAPRQIHRVAEIARQLEKVTASWSLWSQVKKTNHWETDILLVDTLGDLRELLNVADIGFVGGSLIPHGGQNPLEPAAAGIPVLFGMSMENFHEEAAELKRVGAARQVRHAKDLLLDIRELVQDENARTMMGMAGARFVESRQGASEKIVSGLEKVLRA